MNAAALLERLDGVRSTGENRWTCKCPAHPDRTPSLAIRELSDGTILLHDFAGCSAADVVTAVGLTLSDLFPAQNFRDGQQSASPQRHPFDSATTLRMVAHEALICTLAANDAVSGKPLSEADVQRCFLAMSRIYAALDAAGVRQ